MPVKRLRGQSGRRHGRAAPVRLRSEHGRREQGRQQRGSYEERAHRTRRVSDRRLLHRDCRHTAPLSGRAVESFDPLG